MSTNNKSRLAYWLIKDMNKAIRDYKMIQDGDMIGVAVSGGNDSLSLLELLLQRQVASKEKYSLCAIHVVGNANGPVEKGNLDLLKWLRSCKIKVGFENIILPVGENLPMDCERCSWNKKRTIFEIANKMGCNKIAFGHHADDFAVTTMMNLFFSGRVETMAPCAEYFDGIFHLIRPMCYISENQIHKFAEVCDFPPQPQGCLRSKSSRRRLTEELIMNAESWSQDIRVNLLRAGLKGNQVGGYREKSC